jgi:septal ring factor EnvC (AmiA/AmiB activator)
MANASLERQLLAAQASKTELEAKLREKDIVIERLERDRRWFAEREEKEREEKLQEQSEREEEKVRHANTYAIGAHSCSIAQGRFRTSTTTQLPRCRSREARGTRGRTLKPFSQPLTIVCFS